MNHVYQVVWNETTQSMQAVCELGGSIRKKSKSKKSRYTALAVSFAVTGVVSSMAQAQLPTGGVIAAGNGSIAVNGNTMTVNQATPKLVTNWQSFSVGSGKTVEFVQPSSNAVALNRVLGADVSTIQGSIRANGQVFLLNPNGVLFTPTAQVNVGGLVASTLNLSDQDFLAGKFKFEGTSSNLVVNQGNIRAAQGGTVALVAARIVNEAGASINADGGQVLLGAGSKVTLDLGGPMRIKVEQGALQALIDQGGAIQADGGRIYLTAQSADVLARTVINHTGVTRAQTVATGEKGEIYLLGGMEKDKISVNGTLDGSAPRGGDGGFVETSAAQVNIADSVAITTKSTTGVNGQLLIDPYDFSVKSSGGNITGSALGGLLNTADVTIQTATTPGITGYASSAGNGDILITDNIIKTAGALTTKLTLLADRNIKIIGPSSNSPLRIEGLSGAPLDLVFSSRANAGANNAIKGHVDIQFTRIKTYGGNVTIGGGDSSASGSAIAQSLGTNGWAGVQLGDSLIDTSSNAGAVTDYFYDWQGIAFPHHNFISGSSSALSGGSVIIRGLGSPTLAVDGSNNASSNSGVWLYSGSSIATAGTGTIELNGTGGNGNGPTYGRVASVGVLLEGRAALITKTGNITINGNAGTGYDAYGVAFTEGRGLIKTDGQLMINAADSTPTNKNDNAVLIRDGLMTFNIGSASEIHAPLVGGSSNPLISSVYAFSTNGAGTLTLLGDASAWNANLPGNTPTAKTAGTFNVNGGDLLLGTGLGMGQALYSFWQPPVASTSSTFGLSVGAIASAGVSPGADTQPIRISKLTREQRVARGEQPADATEEEIEKANKAFNERNSLLLRGILPPNPTENELLNFQSLRRAFEARALRGEEVIEGYGSPEENAKAKAVRSALIASGITPRNATPQEKKAAEQAQKDRQKMIANGVAPPIPPALANNPYYAKQLSDQVELAASNRVTLIKQGVTPGNPTPQERTAAQNNRKSLITRGVTPPGANVFEKMAASFNKKKWFW